MGEIIDLAKNIGRGVKRGAKEVKDIASERKTAMQDFRANRAEERANRRRFWFELKRRWAVRRSNIVAVVNPRKAEEIMQKFRERNIANTGDRRFDSLSARYGVKGAADMLRSEQYRESAERMDQITERVNRARSARKRLKAYTRSEGSSVETSRMLDEIKEEINTLKNMREESYESEKGRITLDDLGIPEDYGIPGRRR